MKVPTDRAIYPSNQIGVYLLCLALSKLFKGIGLFLSYDILKSLHVIHFLFFTKITCSLVFGLLQKPITPGGRLSRSDWIRVVRHSMFGCVLDLMWLFGLTMVGPFRFILLFEHGEAVVIAGAVALYSGTTGPSKTRGAFFFLFGVLSLLLLDHDHKEIHPENPDGHHSNLIFHFLYHMVSWFGLSDHKGGVLLLFLTLCLQALYHSASKTLCVEVGGAKRLHALSFIVSAVLLMPWSLVTYVTYSTPSTDYSLLHRISVFLIIAFFTFILDFYITSLTSSKLGSLAAARLSSLSVCFFGLLLSLIWNHPLTTAKTTLHKVAQVVVKEHSLSGGVLLSFGCITYACIALTGASRGSNKANFIGYSSVGLPLYTRAGEHLSRTGHSLMTVTRSLLQQVMEDVGSRRIFYFLLLNMCFTGVELLYGVWTNSLGLISDGFHMVFDSSALIMGLYASVMSRWKPNRLFSFGFDRVEVLSGFINGLFLVVISATVFFNGICRLLHPPKVHTERLLFISIAGLLVNLVGIFAFRHTHSHGGGGGSHGHSHGGASAHGHSHGNANSHGHSHGSANSHGHSHGSANSHGHSHGGSVNSHGHSHGGGQACPSQRPDPHEDAENSNMRGVFLHILADTLGSVGVIFSTLLIEYFGLYVADPVCSLFIAGLIFLSVLPLLQETLGILALRTPPRLDLERVLRLALDTPGVVAVRNPTAWQLTAASPCLSLHLQVASDAREQQVLAQLKQALQPLLPSGHLTVQVEKDDFHQHMFGMGNKVLSDVVVTSQDLELPQVTVHFV